MDRQEQRTVKFERTALTDDVEMIIALSNFYKERLGCIKVLPGLPWANGSRTSSRISRPVSQPIPAKIRDIAWGT